MGGRVDLHGDGDDSPNDDDGCHGDDVVLMLVVTSVAQGEDSGWR